MCLTKIRERDRLEEDEQGFGSGLMLEKTDDLNEDIFKSVGTFWLYSSNHEGQSAQEY
jgi:hypothetical protein